MTQTESRRWYKAAKAGRAAERALADKNRQAFANAVLDYLRGAAGPSTESLADMAKAEIESIRSGIAVDKVVKN